MSSTQNDPDETIQKTKKTKFQWNANAFRSLLRKILVHRQTLMFFFNLGFGLYKLIKFLMSFF